MIIDSIPSRQLTVLSLTRPLSLRSSNQDRPRTRSHLGVMPITVLSFASRYYFLRELVTFGDC